MLTKNLLGNNQAFDPFETSNIYLLSFLSVKNN